MAQEVLAEVRQYEANPDTPVYELIRMYRENVINVYPGTKAAREAEKAIERLQKGQRIDSTKPPASADEKTPEAGEESPPADG